jgi:transcriptional regulator with GAF, ATPase, and Fis domain
MATLITVHKDKSETSTPVFKSLTTIGADPESDIPLSSSSGSGLAAHITYDGEKFTIATADKRSEILVSGNSVRKQILVDGDTIRIGDADMRFMLDEKPEVESIDDGTSREREIDAYRRLLSFSEALGQVKEIPALLERLMDEIIQLTQADKGFLVLLEDREPRVRVARNLAGETLEKAVAELSDTIIAKVFSSQKPLIVSNALEDSEFNSSHSVINLKLTSVMCAPLLNQGEVFGAIYVGNNSVINLFDDTALELLNVFCGQASLLVQKAIHINALTEETGALKEALEDKRYGEVIGSCDSMRKVFKTVDKVARADISVLVTGETGTGKELIAREIHRNSPRAKGPLVVINCGAIPENLLESELFGHVKGAFTGAIQTRPGKFQAANGGTLFLDEIGEMPMHLQVKILRSIQEKVVNKVGDTRTDPVDIRIVAATHRDLNAMVKEGTFREDLYYRLNVVNVHLPALRDRDDDIIVIANFLLKKFKDEFDSSIKGFTMKSQTAIRKYAWPGNVRQLENRVKRAMVLCESEKITPEDLDITSEDLEDILPLNDAIERFRRRYINEALARNVDNRTKTAKELGVDPRTIFRHLEAERGQPEEGES